MTAKGKASHLRVISAQPTAQATPFSAPREHIDAIVQVIEVALHITLRRQAEEPTALRLRHQLEAMPALDELQCTFLKRMANLKARHARTLEVLKIHPQRLPLIELEQRFNLTVAESWTLWLALAPSLRPQLARLCRLAGGDARPSLGLIAEALNNALGLDFEDTLHAFRPGGVLRRWRLIEVHSTPQTPLVERCVGIDEDTLQFVRGIGLDEEPIRHGFAHPIFEPWREEPARGYEAWVSSPIAKRVHEALTSSMAGGQGSGVVLMPPVPPSQLHGFVQALYAMTDTPVIELDLKAILEAKDHPLDTLSAALRGSLFHGPSITLLYFERTRLRAFEHACGIEALAQRLAWFPSSLLVVPASQLEQRTLANVLMDVEHNERVRLVLTGEW